MTLSNFPAFALTPLTRMWGVCSIIWVFPYVWLVFLFLATGPFQRKPIFLNFGSRFTPNNCLLLFRTLAHASVRGCVVRWIRTLMCSHLRLVVDQNTHVFPLTPVGCGPEHSCVPTNLLFFCVSVFLLLLVVSLLPACFLLSCCRLHALCNRLGSRVVG